MDFHIEKVAVGEPLWQLVCEHFPRSVKWLHDPNDDGEYHFFLAINPQGTFLGGVVVDIGPMSFGPLAGRIEGFLEDIEVAEPFRRRGIGTALARAALQFAWQREARHVRWTVAYDNPTGLAFYDSLGVAFIPEEDPQRPDPDDRCYTVVALNPQEQRYA